MDAQPNTKGCYGSVALINQSCLKGLKTLFAVLLDSLIRLIVKYIQRLSRRGGISTNVIDDLMHEMSELSDIGKLFKKGRSHLNCNIILLWQNVFPKGPR